MSTFFEQNMLQLGACCRILEEGDPQIREKGEIFDVTVAAIISQVGKDMRKVIERNPEIDSEELAIEIGTIENKSPQEIVQEALATVINH